MRRSKDCPDCRLTAHLGRCGTCGGQGTIPLCPPVGEWVVLCFLEGDCYPLLVLKSVREVTKESPATVYVCGKVEKLGQAEPHYMTRVPGPAKKPGHWHWREDPS